MAVVKRTHDHTGPTCHLCRQARIQENFDVVCEISEEDMAVITNLDAGLRMGWGGPKVVRDGVEQPRDLLHPHYPFREGIEF